jgi:glucokinase
MDFTVHDEEDFEILKFAKEFIETSNNIENARSKEKIYRVSIQRVVSGPGIPLLYAFMKQKYPDLESTLEKIKNFDDMESKDIVDHAMLNKDPLCLKVVDKFISLFGVAVGNFALKTLPHGGIYMVGGVLNGIHDYFIKNIHIFMESFHNKGRLSDLMRQFPVFLVDSRVNVGILGAEEMAKRILMKKVE